MLLCSNVEDLSAFIHKKIEYRLRLASAAWSLRKGEFNSKTPAQSKQNSSFLSENYPVLSN